MPCFHPVPSWYSKEVLPSGKNKILYGESSYHPAKALNGTAPDMHLPCGYCSGCRERKACNWAIRCYHESLQYDDNCFITLTFDDEHLAKRVNPHSVDVEDYQKFMKKLRKKFVPKCPYPVGHAGREGWLIENAIRFFHCGEYGGKKGRPHYHAILFNFRPDDLKFWKNSDSGHPVYTSDVLADIWGNGQVYVGDVSYESACYVARYVIDKWYGEDQDFHYTDFDRHTGEILVERKPEYTTMSRNPGIGRRFIDGYIDDVYPHDFVTVNGVKMPPPKYYDKQLELLRPYDFEQIKFERELRAEERADDNTPFRLAQKEAVKKAQLGMLKRA